MTPIRSTIVLALALGLLLLGAVGLRSPHGGVSDGASVPPTTASSAGGSTTGEASGGGATGLDPGLVAAYEQARAAAAAAGHDLVINSGFRTAARQQELLDEEVLRRGSYEAATRWVFPPDRSMHVQGLAIDVGDGDAADWLRTHGAPLGLCHTLSWEWWHFEWRQRWQEAGRCPAEAADPSEAPAR